MIQYDQPSIFTSDSNPQACAKIEQIAHAFSLSDIIKIDHRDFFELVPHQLSDQPGLVVLNPPYGRRMGNRRESKKKFDAICDKLFKDFVGWKLALIVPPGWILKKALTGLQTTPMLHGGLKLRLITGRIPKNG